MTDSDNSALIESHRGYLLGVACRILGNASDAQDAAQEALLRFASASALPIDNPRAWLTTTVGRICIDMLRARRSRRKVRGDHAGNGSLESRRKVIEAFLAASREGNFEALVALLDPQVQLQIDPRLLGPGMPAVIRGAEAVGKQALLGKGRRAQLAMINGDVGILVAGKAPLDLALSFTQRHGRILRIRLIADPARLQALQIAVLSGHTNTSGGRS